MYFDKKQFPELPFFSPHSKAHIERGFIKHYHFRFYPKLGHGICATRRIPCACVSCISMIDQPCISGIPSKNKHATNLSHIVLTVQLLDNITIGI